MMYIALEFIGMSEIVIETNDSALINLVKIIYPYCYAHTYVKESKNNIIKVYKYDGFYRANYKQYFYENLSQNSLIYFLYEMFQVVFEEIMLFNSINVFHGSCIEKNGNAFIFSGKTNAGKSTLVYDLNYFGYNYLSDDYAILSKDNLSLQPLHLPIKLRSLKPVCEKSAKNVIVRDYNPVNIENYYLLKPFSYCKNKNYKLSALFLINRNDFTNLIKKLDYKEAYKNLIINAKIPEINAIKRISAIALSMAKGIDVYEIQYTDTVSCKNMVDSILSVNL